MHMLRVASMHARACVFRQNRTGLLTAIKEIGYTIVYTLITRFLDDRLLVVKFYNNSAVVFFLSFLYFLRLYFAYNSCCILLVVNTFDFTRVFVYNSRCILLVLLF